MTIKELYNIYLNAFSVFCDIREARSSAYLLMSDLHGISKEDTLLRSDSCVDNSFDYNSVVEKIALHTPVQYICGRAHFCDMDFMVTKSVLIPRPESEELVQKIVEKTAPNATILDIGTGSGAIAISLSKRILGSKVTALDISNEALSVARKNAEILNSDVRFISADILKETLPHRTYDVIVSNPPYVRESEKEFMLNNVLDHEPHIALFVSDSDPLLFYRRIAKLSLDGLKIGGWLYFEINEAFSQEMLAMLSEMGFINVECLKDLFDKDRIIIAQLS